MRIVRTLALLTTVFVVLAALCALVGVLIAAVRDSTSYVDAIAWAMWIGGAVVVLLAAMSGSPAARAEDSRVVVGGRFVQGSNIPQPQSPFILIPAGLLVTGLGVLLYLIA